MEQVSAGGVGNKVMMLLEERGNAYIQDRGVARWCVRKRSEFLRRLLRKFNQCFLCFPGTRLPRLLFCT